jgi:hypothetical protein
MNVKTLKRGRRSLCLLAAPLFLLSCASTPPPPVVKSDGHYAIGDRGPAGGWIFYDKGDNSQGWRYLEAAPEDQSTGWTMGDWAAWGCDGKSIPDARRTAIGTGRKNTEAILKGCAEPAIAARKSAAYRGGGKSDWFLPSKDELNALYLHLRKPGIGGLAGNYYWSSSETANGRHAWGHNFTTGDQHYANKYPKWRVRAIRAFAELDPYDIQRRITSEADYDVAGLWRALGIDSELATVYPRVGSAPGPPERFEACRGDCAAEIHPLQWRGEADKIVALKITQDRGWCRYLLFRQVRAAGPGGAAWRFIGQADHDFARHRPPEHRTQTLGGGNYFVMTAQSASGTGVSLEYERWYAVAPGSLKEVLSLPRRGHECPSAQSLCRSFSARIDEGKSAGGRIHVTFSVEYQGNRFLLDGRSFVEIPLFTKQRRAVYAPAGESGDFVLSPGESEITAEEIRRTCSIGDWTCEDFIRFNGDASERLAAGPQGEAAAWLKRYVAECEPSAGRDRLLEAQTK